jgi:phenylacetate-CoA ligase
MRHRLASLRRIVAGKPSREETARFQAAQLRRLVRHAYERVPYYRARFERAGLDPRAIRGLADLERIPLTSKRDLLAEAPQALVARGTDPDSLLVRRTSGASGEPFNIRRTWLEERILTALRRRALHEVGLRPRDRIASVQLPRAIQPRDRQWLSYALAALGLYRTTRLNCLDTPDAIAAQLQALAADVVVGFPVVLERVAEAVVGSGLRVRPRLVLIGGEVMTPPMRERMGEAFAAPVIETYGAHEFNLVASECAATGELHVSEGLLLEVVRDGRAVAPGEAGEVVATNLHAFAMPFIRYRLADVATQGLATCPCGRGVSTIREVKGRQLDYFSLPGGRSVHPYGIILPMLGEAPWIRQYRLIQDREDRVVLEAAVRRAPAAAELRALTALGAERLGHGVEFLVRVVDELPLEPSGKFRVARSLVRTSYGDAD